MTDTLEKAQANHRLHERVDVKLPVTLRFNGRLIPATALNLSCGGVMLDAEAVEAQPESGVEVVLDLGALEKDVTIRGEVAWQDTIGGNSRVGIRFTNLFTMGYDAISQYLNRLKD